MTSLLSTAYISTNIFSIKYYYLICKIWCTYIVLQVQNLNLNRKNAPISALEFCPISDILAVGDEQGLVRIILVINIDIWPCWVNRLSLTSVCWLLLFYARCGFTSSVPNLVNWAIMLLQKLESKVFDFNFKCLKHVRYIKPIPRHLLNNIFEHAHYRDRGPRWTGRY